MNIMGLKKEIAAGKIRPLYLFVGEERGMMDLYIKKLGKATIKANKLADIVPRLTGGRLFADNAIYVVKDDEDIVKKEVDLFRLIKKNKLVLCFGDLDKRSKFYKTYKDYIVDFDKVDESQLTKFVQNELNLDIDLASLVAQRCNYNFSRIELEVDKLARLEEISEATIVDVVTPMPEDVVFEMIKYMTKAEAVYAFDCYKELKQRNESPIKIISLLYTNFRNLLLVQGMEGKKDKEIAEKTGLNPWVIGRMKEQVGAYQLNTLLTIMRAIQGAEFGIKTGQIEQEVAMEKLLVDILLMAG